MDAQSGEPPPIALASTIIQGTESAEENRYGVIILRSGSLFAAYYSDPGRIENDDIIYHQFSTFSGLDFIVDPNQSLINQVLRFAAAAR